jgi:hypothetical protein
MAEWRLLRDGTEEPTLYDVQTELSANPFGDVATARLDDEDGKVAERFAFGTPVELQVAPTDASGGSFSVGAFDTDFNGFVVESKQKTDRGADIVELTIYRNDQFLRLNDVSNDQTDATIDAAIEDIIKTDTPVDYNASKVDVQDNERLTLSLQDRPVEEALLLLAFKSGDEEFGVDDTLEFFFEPREREHNDRGIAPEDVFDYDIPERGREAINEVEVRFDGGTQSVVVDAPTDKLDLQESIGLSDPGTQRKRINRPEITTVRDAEDEARQFLQVTQAAIAGEVTTFDLFDLEPFDTIDVSIPDAGVDGEFVVTSVQKEWIRDETTVGIVEKRGLDDSTIARLEDKAERVDLRGSDPDADENRVTSTEVNINLDADATATVTAPGGGTTQQDVERGRVVNAGRNRIRDAWRGEKSPPDIDTLVVGSDNSGLSRSNTELRNQTASASVPVVVVSGTKALATANITQTNVAEIGLLTAGGTLLTRLVLPEPRDFDGSVGVSVTVSDDANTPRSVITTDGQQAVRDIIADNAPALPSQYRYGSDGTAPAVSDTSIVSPVTTLNPKSKTLEDISTQAEWQNYSTGISPTDPVRVTPSGAVELTPIAFAFDFQDGTNNNIVTPPTPGLATDGKTVNLNPSLFGTSEFDFTLKHTIPAGELQVDIRFEADDPSASQADGYEINLSGPVSTARLVSTISTPTADSWNEGFVDAPSQDMPPGNYTLQIQNLGGSTDPTFVYADAIAIYDQRFESELTFDTFGFDSNGNPNGGSGEFLDGPERFPNTRTVDLSTTTAGRPVDRITINSAFNNTTGGQFIAASTDNGTSFKQVSNAQNNVFQFATGGLDLTARFALDRFGTQTGTTPLTGVNGQQVNNWELSGNPGGFIADGIGESLTVAATDTTAFQGSTLREAGHIAGNGDLLTRAVFADTEIDANVVQLISSETVRFNPE